MVISMENQDPTEQQSRIIYQKEKSALVRQEILNSGNTATLS